MPDSLGYTVKLKDRGERMREVGAEIYSDFAFLGEGPYFASFLKAAISEISGPRGFRKATQGGDLTTLVAG